MIARRLGDQVVSVSGDLFYGDGRPHGILIQNGVLHHGPAERRSSLGIDAAGNLDVQRVELTATWNGSGQRRPLLLNREPKPKRRQPVHARVGPGNAGSLDHDRSRRHPPADRAEHRDHRRGHRAAPGERPIPPEAPCSSAVGPAGSSWSPKRLSARGSACASHSSPRGPGSCPRSAAAPCSCGTAAPSSGLVRRLARRCSPHARRAPGSGSGPTGGSCSSSPKGAASVTASECRTTSSRARSSGSAPSRASRSRPARAPRSRATAG